MPRKPRNPRLYLQDILDSIQQLQNIDCNREQFFSDNPVQYACIRCLEVIGEAAGHLPAEVKQLQPQIPWRRIAAMRNWLIHGYHALDLEIIRLTVETEIPVLRTAVELLITEQGA